MGSHCYFMTICLIKLAKIIDAIEFAICIKWSISAYNFQTLKYVKYTTVCINQIHPRYNGHSCHLNEWKVIKNITTYEFFEAENKTVFILIPYLALNQYLIFIKKRWDSFQSISQMMLISLEYHNLIFKLIKVYTD